MTATTAAAVDVRRQVQEQEQGQLVRKVSIGLYTDRTAPCRAQARERACVLSDSQAGPD